IKRIRLGKQFVGAAEQESGRDHQEAAENVEANHASHPECENAKQNKPGQKLLCEVTGTAPSPTGEGERTKEQKQDAQSSMTHMRGHEGRSRRDKSREKQTAEHCSSNDGCCGEQSVKVQAERSLQRAMHRRPVS